MGTMVGDDGAGNQIGMAPGAQWIACRNMEQGWGTPATYAECYEWFIAPYPVGGDPMFDGDPAKAPHVINNSWSCPIFEGCTNPNILRTVVENVRAAGIVTAHSAGNSPGCGTIQEPAAIYDASFTVGATDSTDDIAGFSSRGPTTAGNNDPAKPDISAPGVGVRSSVRGGSYGTSSGTSMAAPHVAGLVGLLMSARPDLAGNVDALEQVIKESALPRFSSDGCGGDEPDSLPNYTYGWGRIDAFAAYQMLKPDTQYLVFNPIWIEQQT
jgi:subtilisin family serine protease